MSKEAIKITKPITGYSVAKEDDSSAQSEEKKACCGKCGDSDNNVIEMHEKLERPEMLLGSTYKIKTPLDEHAMYVTINDHILNEGTEHEKRVPFEVFINSKNMEHFQWIVALTRIISAVFRKGGDVTFLVEELNSVFDPKGGFFDKGTYINSTVHMLGQVIEKHLKMIGLIESEELDEHQKKLIEEKRAQYEASVGAAQETQSEEGKDNWPAGATQCPKCNQRAMIVMDGCKTCLSCGDSKCG